MRLLALMAAWLLLFASGSTAAAAHLPPVLPVLPGTNHDHENLADLDFSGADLRNVSLIDADLSRSNFTGADFREATLFLTNVEDAIFDGGDLSGLDFGEILGARASFRGANVSGADFEEAFIDGWDFEGADLSNGDFDDIHSTPSNFRNALFVGATLNDFQGRESNFSGAVFTDAFIISSDFMNADFRGADLSALDPNSDLAISIFDGATYNAQTLFPAEFDPQQAGMVLVPEPGAIQLASAAVTLLGCIYFLRRRQRRFVN